MFDEQATIWLSEIMNEINTSQQQDLSLYQHAQALLQQGKIQQSDEAISSLIKENSENASYYLLLAQIKKARGHAQEQLVALTTGLVLEPSSSEFLVKIALVHFQLCNVDECYRFVELAEKNDNNTVDILDLISDVYNKLGEYAKAVIVLQKAVQIDNSNPELYLSLGKALTNSGKIKEAIAVYQHALQLNPNLGLVYAALTKARKATLEDNNVEKLQELSFKDRNSWTAVNIYHGLAKELDDLGRYKEAFEALTKGKKRLRTTCPHDPNKGADNIQRLIALYEKNSQEINASNKGSTKAPIFVTGMPRTGTTVVERILTNHPDVVTVGERFQFGAALRRQCKEPYTNLIDAKALDKQWTSINFEQLGHDYIKSTRYLSNNNQRFVDKLPLNILCAGVILKALPQAKIVCLLRDPLDTVVGNYRQILEQTTGTYAYTLDLYALANFVYEFRNLVSSLKQQFPSRFIVVKYESLVSEPEIQAKRLFNFCDLTWDEACLDIHKNKAQIGTASAAQVQEPIHKKSLGQSRNYMFCLEEIKKAFQEKEC